MTRSGPTKGFPPLSHAQKTIPAPAAARTTQRRAVEKWKGMDDAGPRRIFRFHMGRSSAGVEDEIAKVPGEPFISGCVLSFPNDVRTDDLISLDVRVNHHATVVVDNRSAHPVKLDVLVP